MMKLLVEFYLFSNFCFKCLWSGVECLELYFCIILLNKVDSLFEELNTHITYPVNQEIFVRQNL
jgi:hypothetical protein